MVTIEMKPKSSLGQLISTIAQKFLNKIVNISLDSPTRVAFSIDASETEIQQIIDQFPGSINNFWGISIDGVNKPLPIISSEFPPRSTHISTIDAIDTTKARPVRIKRVWEGKDYFYDCLVTESVKDQYLAGDVKVGDYVIVHFDDIGEQIVTGKVFKSW